MPVSRFARGCLVAAVVTLALLAALLGYAWYEVHRIADSNINGKAFMNTAGELQAFVVATGRWPDSEEEFIHWEGGYFGWFDRQEEASRTIILYEVDLAEEDLDSVENFRLLKPRDPERFEEYVAYTHSIPELLTTLRAARDGKLPVGTSANGRENRQDAQPSLRTSNLQFRKRKRLACNHLRRALRSRGDRI